MGAKAELTKCFTQAGYEVGADGTLRVLSRLVSSLSLPSLFLPFSSPSCPALSEEDEADAFVEKAKGEKLMFASWGGEIESDDDDEEEEEDEDEEEESEEE